MGIHKWANNSTNGEILGIQLTWGEKVGKEWGYFGKKFTIQGKKWGASPKNRQKSGMLKNYPHLKGGKSEKLMGKPGVGS